MKALHRRSAIVVLLTVFLVAVIVGTLLPSRVMAEVTSVLTGKGTAGPNDIRGGCQICEWVWKGLDGWYEVCRYYNPCPTE